MSVFPSVVSSSAGTGVATTSPFGPTTNSPFPPATTSPFGPATNSPFGPATASPFGAEAKRNGLVLLIEDDEGVADMVERFLGRLGKRVLRARDGAEGAQLFAEYEK